MFPNSVKYDGEKITKAIDAVKSMSANLGGTEIYHPLQNILEEEQAGVDHLTQILRQHKSAAGSAGAWSKTKSQASA